MIDLLNSYVLHSYSTNTLWEGIYHESGFSKSCHLITPTRKLSEKNDNFVVFWDLQIPNNEISHYLNIKRKEKNICHGISFCSKNRNGVLEVLSLAGRACDLNFAE